MYLNEYGITIIEQKDGYKNKYTKPYSLKKLLKIYEKYPIYDNEGHKLEMRVIVFCPTILSTANPIYDS